MALFRKMAQCQKTVCAQFKITPELVKLRQVFSERGYELRLVGGVVRDLLLGQHPNDYDLATPATPQAVIETLEQNGIKVVETGLQHGTVTAVISHIPFEITTLRIDTDHDGRHCTIKYTEDWKLDAERRDLTINAMSMDLDGNVFDYFNGEKDLRAQKVRFVGDPMCRIEEDYLRILRYFRFHARICKREGYDDEKYDRESIKAIKEKVDGLARISGERIQTEMLKILQGPRVHSVIFMMRDCGVLDRIYLNNIKQDNLKQLGVVRGSSDHPITVLATLINSPEKWEIICQKWHLSRTHQDLGAFIINNRSTDVTLESMQDLLVDSAISDLERVRERVVELCKYQQKMEMCSELTRWEVPVCPVRGKDIIAAGVKPGKEVGKALQQLRTSWKDSRFTKPREILLTQLQSNI
eukprot:m.64305 g.64305  ORF g.64305 m.64305 type:complete len:412 (-) comp11639_c0_seq1:13-1248(-)